MWSRIRPNLIGVTAPGAEARLQALRLEVERVATVRSNVERATQLARVLDAVSALAASHGLTDAELSALRSEPVARAAVQPGLVGLRQQLKQRASDVVAQVVGPGTFASSITELAFGSTGAKQVVLPKAASKRGAAGRSPVVVRVGAGRAAGRAGMQLIAASLLHLPRLHRQIVAVRRSADLALHGADLALQGAGFALQGAGFALQTAKLMRLQATHPAPKSPSGSRPAASQASVAGRPTHTAASLLLWSGRSGLQLTYEIATAGAQLLLRRYVLPRVLRYLSSGATRREIAPARPLRPLRAAR